MGQAKHNPVAQLAKEGKIPPKEEKMGKRKRDSLIRKAIFERNVLCQYLSHMVSNYSMRD